jgi:tyrosyl-tRNA synthetase
MNLFQELKLRGLIASSTITEENLEKIPNVVYCGFDPTGASLHLGHLLPIFTIKRFQLNGWKPLFVIGGATAMIGDPSGKNAERNLLEEKQVEENCKKISLQIANIVCYPICKYSGVCINNIDWISKMSFIDWLREVGKYFTVNNMLAKDSASKRIESESGISSLNFSYMTLQSYDFFHLMETKNCFLQVGGNDQLGNIIAGTDLIRKKAGKEAFGITLPLIMTSNGEKFGKSANNAIWLDRNMTSPYKFFQYFINVTDEDVKKFLLMFTFLSIDEIEEIHNEHLKDPAKRSAQKKLAYEVTKIVHSEEDAKKSERMSNALFSEDFSNLEEKDIEEIFGEKCC